MLNFILSTLFWTVALYGLCQIIKEMIYSFTYSKTKENAYIIIAVKNGEDYIEGVLRTTLSRILYNSKLAKQIIVVDLNSSDTTGEILKKIEKDNNNITIMNWDKCKDMIEKLSN